MSLNGGLGKQNAANGEVVHAAGYYMQTETVTADNLFKMCDLIQKDAAFLSKEAAEARLKELERGVNDIEVIGNIYDNPELLEGNG